MGALTALTFAGMVAAFLMRVLGGGAVDAAPAVIEAGVPIEEAYNTESIYQAAELFSDKYMSVVDEVASFQTDPDLGRAEARRQEMVSFGGTLANAFHAFAVTIQGDLEGLAVQPDGQLEALPVQQGSTSTEVLD